jgi:hypothetical protein
MRTAPFTDPLAPIRPPNALRGSLVWIGVLVLSVGIATAVQLARRSARASIASVGAQMEAAQAAPAPVAQAPAAPAAPPQADLARFTKMTDAAEFLKQPEVAEPLKKLLGADFAVFEGNFVLSGAPDVGANSVTFSGCMPHACTVSEAAASISTDTGEVVAAILEDKRIRVYSTKLNRLDDCPPGLRAWAQTAATNAGADLGLEFRTAQQ